MINRVVCSFPGPCACLAQQSVIVTFNVERFMKQMLYHALFPLSLPFALCVARACTAWYARLV